MVWALYDIIPVMESSMFELYPTRIRTRRRCAPVVLTVGTRFASRFPCLLMSAYAPSPCLAESSRQELYVIGKEFDRGRHVSSVSSCSRKPQVRNSRFATAGVLRRRVLRRLRSIRSLLQSLAFIILSSIMQ